MGFKKYKKKDVVIGGQQITSSTDGDYGTLGSLASGDWILTLTDGSLVTLDNSSFVAKYDETSDTTTLTGTDYD